MREELVIIYHDGTVTPLLRSLEHSVSVYGGPLEAKVHVITLSQPLHHIATISHNHLAALGAPRYLLELPLVYGLFYDGCTLQYTFERNDLTVESLEPSEPTKGWPYTDYPVLLPYAPLEVGSKQQECWEQFRRRAPNLPETQPAEVIVLVPPPATLGFSMWGRGGDGEGVMLVFECSLEEKRIVSYNLCG
jgi:hypothetical protein